MNKENGFTLVELLAVIVVLAIILIIASPQISSTIKESKLKAMRDIAITIATNAEREYMVKTSKNQEGSTITCESLVDMSDDYGNCTLSFNNEGKARIKLEGAVGGRFDGLLCKGTKNNMDCKEKVVLPGYTDAVELLTSKIGTGGLIEDDHGDLRYQGSNPNNYVYFNCTDNSNPTSRTCEIWRIVGLFNVDGEQRVKLVRKDGIGSFSWDSSDAEVNSGYGINQWGPSGSYEGADLMRELNGDYLNSSLSENTNWYNGSNNKKEGTFNKKYVLKQGAQELIGDAIWYTGGVLSNNGLLTLADAYAAERGTQGKICSSGNTCNDEVERTYTWIGKVGLIYPSDFGYASGNVNCAMDIASYNNGRGYCDDNWINTRGYRIWTITPTFNSTDANYIWISTRGYMNNDWTFVDRCGIFPSVYLISDIQMKGSGTTSDPYVFAK